MSSCKAGLSTSRLACLPPGWPVYLQAGLSTSRVACLPPGWPVYLQAGLSPSRVASIPPGWPVYLQAGLSPSRVASIPPGWPVWTGIVNYWLSAVDVLIAGVSALSVHHIQLLIDCHVSLRKAKSYLSLSWLFCCSLFVETSAYDYSQWYFCSFMYRKAFWGLFGNKLTPPLPH